LIFEIGAGCVFGILAPVNAPDGAAAELLLEGILQNAAAFETDHAGAGTAAGAADSLSCLVNGIGALIEGRPVARNGVFIAGGVKIGISLLLSGVDDASESIVTLENVDIGPFNFVSGEIDFDRLFG
jgi:hypothetical protein